jgi:competence protein ComFC
MKIIKKFINQITGLIFPNNCILCNKIISGHNLLCLEDAKELKFILDPKCKICSYPLQKTDEDDQQIVICANCATKKPAFSEVLTIFYYNQAIKKIIADFKYHDQGNLAKKLGFLLYQRAKDHLDKIDIIATAPLHKKRLQKRKFNQSVLLAKWMIKHAKQDLSKENYQKLQKKFIPDLIIKTKDTKPQVSLNKEDRIKNLSKVFLVRKKYLSLIKDKKILLIDDVMTTGTTMQKCAHKLTRDGVKEVIILTFAKSIKEKSKNYDLK